MSDTPPEAWRSNLRPDSPLAAPLADASPALLAKSYELWWAMYTEGIRRAKSSRRPVGVAATDAKAAATEANKVVLGLLAAVPSNRKANQP